MFFGNAATIPAKIIKDIPFPTPCAVICSPIHINNVVPAVNVIAIMSMFTGVGFSIAACNPIDIPTACKNASTTVSCLVTRVVFLCPSAPSLLHCSSVGTTTVNNCMIIAALMYGVILIAKIENLLNAPPENKSNSPSKLPLLNNCSIAVGSTPGTGMCVPIRNTPNITSVNIIRSRSSAILKMFANPVIKLPRLRWVGGGGGGRRANCVN